MKFETPQFEAFWKKKGEGEPPREQEGRHEESEENIRAKEELKLKATSLADEARQAFASNDLSAALEKLQELARVANPERITGGFEFREAKEMFGKDFIGPEAALKTFGVKLAPEELKTIEQIPFSKAELEQAKKLGMMLVLRVPHDQSGKPLTINRMREILDGEDNLGKPDKKKSKMFYRKTGEGWYNDEEFAKKEVTQLGWGLAMKEILEESKSKNWDEQQKVLQEWAKKNGMDPTSVRRRTPVEAAYDTLAYYGANQESLLENTYDWTSVRSSDGLFVNVGSFGADGLYVYYGARDDSHSGLGVCPAR